MNSFDKEIFEINFDNDPIIRNQILGFKSNLEANLIDFDVNLSKDLKEIYNHYFNKLSAYSNKFLNRINYYKNTGSTVKKLEFPNKIKILKKLTEEIDKQLKIVNDKVILIKKKFEFVKNAIINLISSDKEVLIGKINCKNYFTNKINFFYLVNCL